MHPSSRSDEADLPSAGLSGDHLRSALTLTLGASGGIHAAAAPHHFAESTQAGVSFLVGAAAMMAAGALVAVRPTRAAFILTAALLAGAVLAYGLALVGPVPLVATHAEPPSAVGALTKLVEIVGLVAAISLAMSPRRSHLRVLPWVVALYPVVLAAVASAYVVRGLDH